ncbi:MAG: hypothetical protein SNF33_03905 [Candidatus Algichlamydia australiensis]|nr:hypothetical protein [Chlamydiales bacterium]
MNFLLFPLFAISIVLYNDSPFTLKAQIIAADGTDKGTIQLTPQHQFKWQDTTQNTQTFSQTPYTVIWYCKDGNEYGVQQNVGTGYTVPAQASSGRRFCKPDQQQPPEKNS